MQAALSVEYPPTPDIASAVRMRLAVVPMPAPRSRMPAAGWVRPLAAGLAVLVLAVVVVLSASSGAREAVAEFLGLRVKGEQVAILTPPAAGETATPFPTPVALERYATPVAATELEAVLGFEPARPGGAGSPLGTYVVDYADVRVAVLQYETFDIWQVRLPSGNPFFGKGVTALVETAVNGNPAYWIAGGGHIVRFAGPDGTVVAGSERTVDRNTLIWASSSGMNYRLETGLPLEEAIAIASTLP